MLLQVQEQLSLLPGSARTAPYPEAADLPVLVLPQVVDHLHVAAGELVRRGLQAWAGAALQQRTQFYFTNRVFSISCPTLVPLSLGLSFCTEPGEPSPAA